MAYSDVVLADSPGIYWRLGEASGTTTAADASGNGKTGTYSTALITRGVSGLLAGDSDTAIQFPGPSYAPSVHRFSEALQTSQFTAECWVGGAAGSGTILAHSTYANAAQNWRLGLTSSNYLWVIITDTTGTEQTFTATAGNGSGTRHVVFTYDNGAIRLYVNNVLVLNTTMAGGTTIKSTTATFSVGWQNSSEYSAHMVVDEVAWYPSVLSPTQIATHYRAGVGTYAAEVLADSPLVYWRLGESSGVTASDASGNGKTGTIAGSPTLGTTGLLTGDTNTAVTFDGVNDRVSTADSTDLTAFTAEAWIKTTDSSGSVAARDSNTGVNRIFRLWVSGGKAQVFIGAGVVTITGTTTVSDNAVHHIAATYDGATLCIYVDGVLEASTATTFSLPTANTAFEVGSAGGTVDYAGVIDEVAYYTTALTSARIAAHYAAGALTHQRVAALSGSGALSAVIDSGPPQVVANLSGSGVLSATALDAAVARNASLTGNGTLSAVRVVVFARTVNLAGSGVLTAALENSRDANLTGTGDLEAYSHTVVPAYLAVIDPSLDRAPTTVTVIMGNLPPLVTVTFTIDGVTAGSAVSDANGDIEATSVPVDRQFLSGPHTITGTAGTHVASSTFTLGRNPTNVPVDQGTDADPVASVAASWAFQDLMPGGLGTWVMPINPTSMSNPHVRKTVGSTATTAVGGIPHVYEGATPVEWEISGFCPDQTFYNQLVAYASLRYRFYVIDHRSRAWTVAITDLNVKPRKRARNSDGSFTDWQADYTVRFALFSQTPTAVV